MDEDIIEIDDDENQDAAIAQSSASKCLNYECRSTQDLIQPPIFCLSYFCIKGNGKGQKVCKDCYNKACLHFESTSEAIVAGKCPLIVDLPHINETFTLDSDSDDDCTDNVYIDKDSLEFLTQNLDKVIEECMTKYKVQEKMDMCLSELNIQTDAINDSLMEVTAMTENLRKDFDTMLYELSDALRTANNELPELHIQDAKPYVPATSAATSVANIIHHPPPADLPKRGTMRKPALSVGSDYYMKRPESPTASWVKVKLEKIHAPGSTLMNSLLAIPMYQMYREQKCKYARRIVDGFSVAYSRPSALMLEIGTRVIAYFSEPNPDVAAVQSAEVTYYPGIVGEFPSMFNEYRYMIFFDDGYALYVHYNHVFMVLESSKDVWEDVLPRSRSFIRKYLQEYPDRSMVKFTKGQRVATEYKGRWHESIVQQVDCSLVQLYFDQLNRLEWIYRGSRRLKAMYQEELAMSQNKQKYPRARHRRSAISGAPYVQYSSLKDEGDVVFVSEQSLEKPEQRAVAKKSTRPPSAPLSSVRSIRPAVVTREDPPPGKIVYYTPKKPFSSKNIFIPHKCGPQCKMHLQTPVSRLKGYGPLAKPLLAGFYRMHFKYKTRKETIVYKTPCGRSTRNMEELHYYLRLTRSELSVDCFSFDPNVRCLVEFLLEPDVQINRDLSNGQEGMMVPVVNYVDNKCCDFINYSTQRMPMSGVHLNLDPDFLVCCDCVDDCIDKSKCACWQLTLEGAPYIDRPASQIGYTHRRLMDPVITGIYECNSRCKCAKTCLNRVVQNPLQHKLQVFKTSNNRGWGIRCLNDIPQGSFICIYAGVLLTDEMANEGGQNCSDEYYAELDFIEAVENAKEGYEEDAAEIDIEEENKREAEPTKEVAKQRQSLPDNRLVDDMGESIRGRLRKRTSEINYRNVVDASPQVFDDEDRGVKLKPSYFEPQRDDMPDDPEPKNPSVRNMFGRDENVYIMDAKNTGNLGRFLNHSCAPNMFVQNVFVDTHDLRFPWVSFFAMQCIRAGTELTWNYSYDVGSVPGKVLYCHCGSAECKGRLL